jgi:hypothetical protein
MGQLPARLRYAGNESSRSKLAKSEAGNLEAANESAAAATDLAAIHHPGGAGVTRQLREADVILLRLELSAERGVLLHRLALAFVAIDPRGLRHKGTRKLTGNGLCATDFWAGKVQRGNSGIR